MAFHYSPEDACDTLPAGDYIGVLTKVTDGESSTQRPMLTLTWGVQAQGRWFYQRDWIVTPSTIYKLKGLARAWQCIKQFQDGAFNPADHVNRTCGLILQIKPAEGEFPERNTIAGYKPPSEDAATQNTAATYKRIETPFDTPKEEPLDEDMPF